MRLLNKSINTVFDTLNHVWESSEVRRWTVWLLVASFFLTIIVIEAKRLLVLSGFGSVQEVLCKR